LTQDVRTLRGPKCDSDHFLVKVIIKQKLITTRNKFTEKLRWNTSNLKNPKIIGAYSKRLNERLNTQEETFSVGQDWQNIKNVMLEAAKDTIQIQARISRNEWWDGECKEAIKKRTYQEENAFKGEPELPKKNTRKKDI